MAKEEKLVEAEVKTKHLEDSYATTNFLQNSIGQASELHKITSYPQHFDAGIPKEMNFNYGEKIRRRSIISKSNASNVQEGILRAYSQVLEGCNLYPNLTPLYNSWNMSSGNKVDTIPQMHHVENYLKMKHNEKEEQDTCNLHGNSIFSLQNRKTGVPYHIQTNHPYFPKTTFLSPLALYYFDESVPNDFIFKNDGENFIVLSAKEAAKCFACGQMGKMGKGYDNWSFIEDDEESTTYNSSSEDNEMKSYEKRRPSSVHINTNLDLNQDYQEEFVQQNQEDMWKYIDESVKKRKTKTCCGGDTSVSDYE